MRIRARVVFVPVRIEIIVRVKRGVVGRCIQRISRLPRIDHAVIIGINSGGYTENGEMLTGYNFGVRIDMIRVLISKMETP